MFTTGFRAWPALADAKETKEFVVFPPLAAEFRTVAALDQARAFLAERLPHLTFRFDLEVIAEREFSVIPFLGSVGDRGSWLAAYPSAETMDTIAAVLRDFRPSRPN